MANHRWLLSCLFVILEVTLGANFCLGELAPGAGMQTTQQRTNKISFICGAVSPETPLFKKLEAIYRQAFAQLGYDFEMVAAPNQKRSLAEARYGGSDGDCGRTGYLNELLPDSHLVRVDVKILETTLSVWANTPELELNSAEAIEAGKFNVGYPHGSLIAEKFIQTHQLPHTQQLNTPELAIKMLLARRIDLMLNSPEIINTELKRLNLEGKIFNVGTLIRYDAYPYINQKHQALLPRFEAELKKLIPPQGIKLQQPDSHSSRTN